MTRKLITTLLCLVLAVALPLAALGLPGLSLLCALRVLL